MFASTFWSIIIVAAAIIYNIFITGCIYDSTASEEPVGAILVFILNGFIMAVGIDNIIKWLTAF